MTIEIRTLDDDELITEPGFYNISLDRHHSQPCDGVSVTSGILRTMEQRTPADVWAFHQLNPNRWEKKTTRALTQGRAMASYIEGGEEMLRDEFFVITDDDPKAPTANMLHDYKQKKLNNFNAYKPTPDDAPKRPLISKMDQWKKDPASLSKSDVAACEFWHDLTQQGSIFVSPADYKKLLELKVRVEFWAAHDADTRDKITANEFTMLSNMGHALSLDPGAAAAMGGLPEITMAYQDEATGIWVLSRPDNVNLDGTVIDYKKMNTKGGAFTHWLVDSRITEHRYDMQLALAAEAFERLTGQWPGAAGIVAQWDLAPHHVILREIDEEDLRIGQFHNRRAILRFHECYQSGDWPGPGADTASYQRPDGMRERILEEMNTAGVAP